MKEKTPIIYCDTSFLLEYWEADPYYDDSPLEKLSKQNRPKEYDYIKRFITTEKRHESLKPLRRLIDNYQGNIQLVSSVFALMEIYEKHAEWNLKKLLMEATGIDRILNKGRKDIGDMIKKMLDNEEEGKSIVYSLIPYDLGRSLFGVEFKDLQNCYFSERDFHKKITLLSVLQLGVADILHLIAAQKLGAQYLFTYDTDFERVKDIAESNFGVEVICSQGAIEAALSKILK